jgi:hypothetical protein
MARRRLAAQRRFVEQRRRRLLGHRHQWHHGLINLGNALVEVGERRVQIVHVALHALLPIDIALVLRATHCDFELANLADQHHFLDT